MEAEPTFINPFFDCSRGSTYHEQARPENVKALQSHPHFQHAMRNVPMADISLLRQTVPEPPTEAYLRWAVASNYWTNPICGQCYDKSNPGKLFPCNLCGLTFYCSEKCQAAHKEKHKARCCSADGPLDDGPMQLVVITAKLKE